MTIIRTKRTIRAAIASVLLAPFITMTIGFLSSLFFFLLILPLLLFCMWVSREPLTDLWPSMETIYVILGSMVFIAVAAIPLAIRDFFSTGGYETVWQPTDGSQEAAEHYAASLRNGHLHEFVSELPGWSKGECVREDFLADAKMVLDELGPITSIEDVEEIAIAEELLNDTDYDVSVDSVVQVFFMHSGQENWSMLTLQMKSLESFRLMRAEWMISGPEWWTPYWEQEAEE